MNVCPTTGARDSGAKGCRESSWPFKRGHFSQNISAVSLHTDQQISCKRGTPARISHWLRLFEFQSEFDIDAMGRLEESFWILFGSGHDGAPRIRHRMVSTNEALIRLSLPTKDQRSLQWTDVAKANDAWNDILETIRWAMRLSS